MSMRYRRLEADNEPAMGRGNQDFLSDTEAVGQAVITRLRLWRGEWWENVYLGIPMWQSMLGIVGVKKSAIDRIIQDSILQTPDVSNIADMDSLFNTSNRAYQFYCSINTVYGQTTIANNQGEIQR